MHLSRAHRLALFGALSAGLLALLVALLTGTSSPSVAAALPALSWQTGQTVVSLEFDGASADQYGVRTVLAGHRMHATFFVDSGTVDGSSSDMGWAQIRQLAAEGHEIAGHTVDGANLLALERLSLDEVRREICGDRSNLLALGYRVTDFAYPFGAFDATTERFARECGYDSARNVSGIASERRCSGCAPAEMVPPGRPFATRTPANVLATTRLATIEGYVHQSELAGGGWVQLVFHHVCSACGQAEAVTPAEFAALVAWIARQPETVVRTVQQVIGGPVRPAVAGPAPHAAPAAPEANLLANPSLERASGSGGLPECWEARGWGENHWTWTPSADAHSGARAQHLELREHHSGGAMLQSDLDLGRCSPTATPGATYAVSAWYRATAPVHLALYTRDARGRWSWWLNGPAQAPTDPYAQISWTTPPLPAGARALGVGLGLEHRGRLTLDDVALARG